MTVFAHAAVSMFLGRSFDKAKKSETLPATEFLYGLCGMLPDVPLGLVSLSGHFTSGTHHHEWITHTPLFWLAVALLAGLVKKKLGFAILIGSWTHLATDWYGGGDGIKFLWPISDNQYGVALSGVHGQPAFQHYFSNPVFLLMEVSLLIYFLYRLFKICQGFAKSPH